MAEASSENPSRKYFCHKCNEGIAPIFPEFICPKCKQGFIEEVEAENEPSNPENRPGDSEAFGSQNLMHLLEQAFAPFLLQSMAPMSTTTQSTTPSNVSSSRGENQPNNYQNVRISLLENLGLTPEIMLQIQSLDRLLLRPTRVGGPVLFNLHGNPADYVWNGGDFDAIVTQLMNQIQGSGPPPLSKEKISEIPIVNISKEQTERSLQCTVCMDDFTLDEKVRKLPCDHHYHDQCIVPWLQMHGTCPICRVVLNPEETPTNTRESAVTSTDPSNPNGSTNEQDILRCNIM